MKSTLIFFAAFLTVLFACSKDSTPSASAHDPVKIDYFGKLYFVSNNNYGCACKKKKSREMNDLLEQILKNDERISRKIEVIRIEYLKKRKKANEVLADYKFEFPPALILVDIRNNVLFKKDFYIDEEHRQILIKKLDELIFENNKPNSP